MQGKVRRRLRKRESPCSRDTEPVIGTGTPHRLPQLLYPRSVAIIGATAAGHKAGGRRWLSAVSQARHPRLYPVTLSGDGLSGHKAYRSLSQIPEAVDLAVVMVPGGAVSEVIAECAGLGVAAAVVISAGFAETGQEGVTAEA